MKSNNPLTMLHRLLLRFPPYRWLVVGMGLDSYRYKKYYRDMRIEESDDLSAADVDGYSDESENEKIVQLMDRLAREVPEPGAVLDIGCGTGRYLAQMRQIWPQAHLEGIDISQEIVEKFTLKTIPGAPIHVLDIETDETFYRENSGKFDIVSMTAIIQILSVQKIPAILGKVRRLLKPTGHLYIQFNVETGEKKTSVGYKRYAIEELKGILEANGFGIVKAQRTDILKDYAFIIARKC